MLLDVTCPKCQNPGLDERTEGWRCPKCSLYIVRTMAERPVSRAEAIAALSGQTVGPLQNFLSREGRPFSASLAYDPVNERIAFIFPDRKPGRPAGFQDSKGEVEITAGTFGDNYRFPAHPGFWPVKVKGREMSPKDWLAVFQAKGKPVEFQAVSKLGKPFSFVLRTVKTTKDGRTYDDWKADFPDRADRPADKSRNADKTKSAPSADIEDIEDIEPPEHAYDDADDDADE